jgi:PAS domain S-box-containing protein
MDLQGGEGPSRLATSDPTPAVDTPVALIMRNKENCMQQPTLSRPMRMEPSPKMCNIRGQLDENMSREHFVLESLAMTETILRMVIEYGPNGILLVNAESKIILVNAQAERMFGYTRSELIDMQVDELIPLRLRGSHARLTAEYYKHPEMRSHGAGREVFALRKDGSEFPIELGLNPFVGMNQTLVLCCVVDISERQRTQELVQAKMKAEEAMRSRGHFLAMMSHEIRTPMNGLMGMVALLAESPLSTEQRMFVDSIQRCTDSLLKIINDILDYSKIEAGQIDVEKAAFDPAEALEDSAVLVRGTLKAKGVQYLSTIHSSVPPHLIGDSRRLTQIILNLLGNAAKFTEHGAVHARMWCSRVEGHMNLYCSVEDTGCGMPPDVLNRSFRPFAQGEADVNRRVGGSGLGLAIAKNLTELMGGSINVESKEGVGSTFTFNIQVDEAIDSVRPTCPMGASPRPGLAVSTTLAPLTGQVLVAEDDAISKRLMTAVLSRMGCVVTVVDNGLEAVYAWQHGQFDVIMMDWEMPVMDGLTATAKIRELERADQSHPHIPILGMTANVMKGDREQMMQAGMDDAICKPLRKAEVHAKLSKWLAVVSENESPVTKCPDEMPQSVTLDLPVQPVP